MSIDRKIKRGQMLRARNQLRKQFKKMNVRMPGLAELERRILEAQKKQAEEWKPDVKVEDTEWKDQ